jgi:hypothetical protein
MVAMLSLLMVVVLASPAFAWTSAVVDSNDSNLKATSLAISGGNKVYVAWTRTGSSQDELWWGQWTGSSWTKTKVASVGPAGGCYTGGGPSAAFDPVENKAKIVSFCSQVAGSKYIYWTHKNNAGTWVTDTLATITSTCLSYGIDNVDLAFDPNDSQPAIAYGDAADGSIHFLHDTNSGWVDDQVATTGVGCGLTGPYPSLAFDPTTGEPAIAWITGIIGDLKYSTYNSSTKKWTTTTINTGKDSNVPSLAITSTGTPWIAFDQATSDLSKQHLDVGHKSGGSWSFTRVDSSSDLTGLFPSITLKGSNPRVAYYNLSKGNLRWAKYDGSTWTFETPDSANDVGSLPSAAFNSNDKPYISYWDDTNKDIRWARTS